MSQQQLGDQGTPALAGRCAWCDTPTRLKIAVRRGGMHTTGNGTRVRQPSLEVWCCERHQSSLAFRGES